MAADESRMRDGSSSSGGGGLIDGAGTYDIFDRPQLIPIEHEHTVASSSSNNDLLATSMRTVEQHMRSLRDASLNDPREYQRSIDRAKLALLEAASLIWRILKAQQYRMTAAQMQRYDAWIDSAHTVAIHVKLSTEATSIASVLLGNLPKLMLTNQEPASLDKIVKSLDDTDNTLNLDTWLFRPKQTFDDFVGRAETIARLRDFVRLMPFVDKYRMICFTGPPGTGKTKFAEAIMTAFDAAECYLLNITELLSQWLGRTESTLKKLFAMLSSESNRHKRYVVFFDEADEIFKAQTSQAMANVSLTIQLALQGSYPLRNNVIVIAATNYKNTIKPTILDRISVFQYIDVPTTSDVYRYFENVCYLRSLPRAERHNFSIRGYCREVVIPLVRALPHQVTFRNLHNLYESAKSACIAEAMNIMASDHLLFLPLVEGAISEDVASLREQQRRRRGNDVKIRMIHVSKNTREAWPTDDDLHDSTRGVVKVLANDDDDGGGGGGDGGGFLSKSSTDDIFAKYRLTVSTMREDQYLKISSSTYTRLMATGRAEFYYRPELRHFEQVAASVNIMSAETYMDFLRNNDAAAAGGEGGSSSNNNITDTDFTFKPKSDRQLSAEKLSVLASVCE